MKEYTVLAVASVFVTFGLHRIFKTGLFFRKQFWIFLGIILFFKLLVNGYLTAFPVVVYDPRFYMGARIGTIPLEDFLFGFSMVTLTLIFWERFKKPVL